MPKKKEETTMLVRSVPLNVSERVRRYCKREGIKYREFLERAIDLFEGSNQEQEQGPGQEEKVNPIQRVAAIADAVKAYKYAIRLQKDLITIRKDINLLAEWEDRRHIYLEVVRMTRELDEIIKKYIPKHEIPDDPEAMAAMGLPSELIYKDLTHEEWEETKKRNEEAEGKWMRDHKPEDFPLPDDVKKRLEEAMRELGIEDMSSSANPLPRILQRLSPIRKKFSLNQNQLLPNPLKTRESMNRNPSQGRKKSKRPGLDAGLMTGLRGATAMSSQKQVSESATGPFSYWCKFGVKFFQIGQKY